MFIGEYHHTVDEKGRIAIPVRFRAELVGGGFVSKWMSGCLAVHTRAAFEALATKVQLLDVFDEATEEVKLAIFGAAFEIDLDSQGRFVIPPPLRAHAGLEGEGTAVVVGTIDRFQLWSPGRWAEFSKKMSQPGAFAPFKGLGIR